MKSFQLIINFSNEEFKKLKQCFNLTPVGFDSFLAMILKEQLFKIYYEAMHEREKRNHYDFTLDDETDLKLHKIIKNWEKLHNPPLNMDKVIKSLVNKEYNRHEKVYGKQEIKKLQYKED